MLDGLADESHGTIGQTKMSAARMQAAEPLTGAWHSPEPMIGLGTALITRSRKRSTSGLIQPRSSPTDHKINTAVRHPAIISDPHPRTRTTVQCIGFSNRKSITGAIGNIRHPHTTVAVKHPQTVTGKCRPRWPMLWRNNTRDTLIVADTRLDTGRPVSPTIARRQKVAVRTGITRAAERA